MDIPTYHEAARNKAVEIRRYEITTRYGDYMAYVCEHVKSSANPEKAEDFTTRPDWDRTWRDMYSAIQRELPLWGPSSAHHKTDFWKLLERKSGQIDPDKVKTTGEIFNACQALGVDFDDILHTIARCARPRPYPALVDDRILELVQRGWWSILIKMLAQDLVDLPTIMPARLRDNIPLLQAIILTIIHEYYSSWNITGRFWRHTYGAVRKCHALREAAKMDQCDMAILAERKRIEAQAAKNHEMRMSGKEQDLFMRPLTKVSRYLRSFESGTYWSA
ncbi:hypothetical protein G7046_g7259 [Stylonectria norvegica]|nr:hypothetical protein G7046_g7259 [Stylonectria norvegica]